MVIRELFAPRNYAAAARIPWTFVQPVDFAQRYFFGGGSYPYRCVIRTPLGRVAATLYSHHDVWTANEVFARRDYEIGSDLVTAVDVGSNIGISGLYFLTRNARSRVFLYEPDPRNIERLRSNLAPFSTRWELDTCAVGPETGTATFGIDPTGRYGGIGVESDDSFEVEVTGINEILERVLEDRSHIDVLKVDTEGLEHRTVAAIRPDLLSRIATIYFEWPHVVESPAEGFDISYSNETVRLTRPPDGAGSTASSRGSGGP